MFRNPYALDHLSYLLTKKRHINPVHRMSQCNYSNSYHEPMIFGIDYGTMLTKVAVYNRKKQKPIILCNKGDGHVSYWHSAVAYDQRSKVMVAGKKAKQIARESPYNAFLRIKNIIGVHLDSKPLKQWKKEHQLHAFHPRLHLNIEPWSRPDLLSDFTDLDPNHLLHELPVTTLLKDRIKTEISAIQIASQVFLSIKESMIEYISQHDGDPNQLPQAYIAIPVHFTMDQRLAIIQASQLAGINVVKLIEEPVAALYNIRRLEPFGWYSIVDLGDTSRSYIIRVFNGKYDYYPDSYLEMPNWIPIADQSFCQYLEKKKSTWSTIFDHDEELIKLFDLTCDHLIDYPEFKLKEKSSRWINRSIPYISREARQLSTFQAIRSIHIGEELSRSISKIVPLESVTHPVLIGGHSLSYPEFSHELERFWSTRLADTVTNPSHAIAVGSALKAAHDQQWIDSILRGKDINSFGYTITSDVQSTVLDQLHPGPKNANYPFPHILNFSNISSLQSVAPLLPAFQEEQLLNDYYLRPFPALSFSLQRDPLSMKPEYWARLSIQTPHSPPKLRTMEEEVIPKTMPFFRLYTVSDPIPDFIQREILMETEPSLDDVIPNIKICFSINLTCNQLHDTSRDISGFKAQDGEVSGDLDNELDGESFEKLMINHPDRAMHWIQHALSHSPSLSDQEYNIEKMSRMDILNLIQKQKNSKNKFFRNLNRAHDMIQFILSNMNDNDYASLVSIGKSGLQSLVEMESYKTIDKQRLLDKVVDSDTLGRAGTRFAELIKFSHQKLLQHMDSVRDEEKIRLEEEIRVMKARHESKIKEQEDSDHNSKKNSDPDPNPNHNHNPSETAVKEEEDLSKQFEAFDEADRSKWYYPGIDRAIYDEWWQVYHLFEKACLESPRQDPQIEDPLDEDQTDASKIDILFEEDYLFSKVDLTSSKKEIQFLQSLFERMVDRRRLKEILGTQHRIVIITDSMPDLSTMKEVEDAMDRASRDHISTTFLSIDGPLYEGDILQSIARVKGARFLRLWRQHLWSTDFLKTWNNEPHLHHSLSDPMIKNVSVRVDFENYTIEKVYGGYLTSSDHQKLERIKKGGGSTIRFKVGSLYPSYDIIPGPTPEENSSIQMLVKLKPKDDFGSHRARDPLWHYDPSTPSTSRAISTIIDDRIPSQFSAVQWEITWEDWIGKKHRQFHKLRLTDFNPSIGYFDEPGIVQLIRIAKFSDLIRKVLYYPFQKALSTQHNLPVFEIDNESTSIRHFSQTEEDQLAIAFQEQSKPIINVANQILKQGGINGNGLGFIHQDYQHAINLFTYQIIKDLKCHPSLLKRYHIVWELLSYYQGTGFSLTQFFSTMAYHFQRRDQIKKMDAMILIEQSKPKWYGYNRDPFNLEASKDRRNAFITANLMNELAIFPRSYMPPIHPTSIWLTNFSDLEDLKSVAHILSKEEEEYNDDPIIPSVMERWDPSKLEIQTIGSPLWKEMQTYVDEADYLKVQKGMDIFEPTLLFDIGDENVFFNVLKMLIDARRENEIIQEDYLQRGHGLWTLEEMEKYYWKHLRSYMNPSQHKEALRQFRRAHRMNPKQNKKRRDELEAYEKWKGDRKVALDQIQTLPGRLVQLVKKWQKDEIDEAERLHTVKEIDSIEQSILDANHVLLKKLTSLSKSEVKKLANTSKDDIIQMLAPYFPEGFLALELSVAQRIRFLDRGPRPQQIIDDRQSRNPDIAITQELITKALEEGKDLEREVEKNHLLVELNTLPNFKSIDESSNSCGPLEIELGRIPLNWDHRFNRLKELAVRGVLMTSEKHLEKDKVQRMKLRAHYTKLAQNSVDDMIFKQVIASRLERAELEDEDFDEDFEKDDIDIDLNSYSAMIASQYYIMRKESKIEFQFSSDQVVNDKINQKIQKYTRILKQYQMISSELAESILDPIKYWYGTSDYGDDFYNVEYKITGEVKPIKDIYKRIRYIQQTIDDQQDRQKMQMINEVGIDDILIKENQDESEFGEGQGEEMKEIEMDPLNSSPPLLDSPSPPLDSSLSDPLPEEEDRGQIIFGATEESPIEFINEEKLIRYERLDDPHGRADFKNPWDYHLYCAQRDAGSLSYDPELASIQRQEAPPLLFSQVVDQKTGEVDWEKFEQLDLAYPRIPLTPTVSISINGVELADQFGTLQPMETTELDIVQQERRAFLNCNFDNLKEQQETAEILHAMATKHGRKTMDPNTMPESIPMDQQWWVKEVMPSHDEFNLRRDDWDEKRVYKAMVNFIGPEAYRRRDLFFQNREDQIMTAFNRQLFHAKLVHIYHFNDPDAKSYCDRMLELKANFREYLYSPVINQETLSSNDMFNQLQTYDTAILNGTYPLVSWKYISLLGCHIPVLINEDECTLWGLKWISKFKIPSPYDVIESTLSNTIFVDPNAPLNPTEEDVEMNECNRAMIDLYRFPSDHFKYNIRKALEKRYGLSSRRHQGWSTLEKKAEDDRERFNVVMEEGWNEPWQPISKVEDVKLTDEESKEEALRLVQSYLSNANSSNINQHASAKTMIEKGDGEIGGRVSNLELMSRFWKRMKDHWREAKLQALHDLDNQSKFGHGEALFVQLKGEDRDLSHTGNKMDAIHLTPDEILAQGRFGRSVWEKISHQSELNLSRDIQFIQDLQAAHRQAAIDASKLKKFIKWFESHKESWRQRCHIRNLPLTRLKPELLLPDETTSWMLSSEKERVVHEDYLNYCAIENIASKVGLSGENTIKQAKKSARLSRYLSTLTVEKRQVFENAIDQLYKARHHYQERIRAQQTEVALDTWKKQVESIFPMNDYEKDVIENYQRVNFTEIEPHVKQEDCSLAYLDQIQKPIQTNIETSLLANLTNYDSSRNHLKISKMDQLDVDEVEDLGLEKKLVGDPETYLVGYSELRNIRQFWKTKHDEELAQAEEMLIDQDEDETIHLEDDERYKDYDDDEDIDSDDSDRD